MMLIPALLTVSAALLVPLARQVRRLQRVRRTAGVFAGFGAEVRDLLAPAPANHVVVPASVWDAEATIEARLRPLRLVTSSTAVSPALVTQAV